MICGGSYPDHLELWWSKHHLYSPFDQHLDKIYNDALIFDDENQCSSASGGDGGGNNRQGGRNIYRSGWSYRNSSLASTSNTQAITRPPSFTFHKPYVKDVSDVVAGIKDPEEQIKLIKKKLKPLLRSDMNYRIKRLNPTGVTYLAPGVGPRPNGNSRFTKKDAFIDILSILALRRVDNVIFEQATEFEYNKKRRASDKFDNNL